MCKQLWTSQIMSIIIGVYFLAMGVYKVNINQGGIVEICPNSLSVYILTAFNLLCCTFYSIVDRHHDWPKFFLVLLLFYILCIYSTLQFVANLNEQRDISVIFFPIPNLIHQPTLRKQEQTNMKIKSLLQMQCRALASTRCKTFVRLTEGETGLFVKQWTDWQADRLTRWSIKASTPFFPAQ